MIINIIINNDDDKLRDENENEQEK